MTLITKYLTRIIIKISGPMASNHQDDLSAGVAGEEGDVGRRLRVLQSLTATLALVSQDTTIGHPK
jgi:hypothetical protein